MSTIVKLGKAGKKILKNIIDPSKIAEVGYCRRIERVSTNERVCAMTFDDGPMALPCAPDKFEGKPLTDVLLDTLNKFDAKGTFDIVGDTSENYPDGCGKINTPSWGGIGYDHYPDYKLDDFGGAIHNERLIKRIISEGHQLSNHGYNHIIFGKKPFVYGQRKYLGSYNSALDDINRLHNYIQNNYNYTMTMSRPPHYVDKINGNITSYDVYEKMNYQYMAASFDGAGWLPSKNTNSELALEEEINLMINPIKNALDKDPNYFCGQIIFQKDGYNMAKRTPVAFALEKQLEILTQYGYKVVTVNELLNYSQFADVSRDDEDYALFDELSKARAICFSDNTIRPDQAMTYGELAMLLMDKELFVENRQLSIENKSKDSRYSIAMDYCVNNGYISANVKNSDVLNTDTLPKEFFPQSPQNISRREILKSFKKDK